MNRDEIKYIAMFTMLLNHIANIFLEPGTLLFEIFVDVGYFTAITMCYFLVGGLWLHQVQREIWKASASVCGDFRNPLLPGIYRGGNHQLRKYEYDVYPFPVLPDPCGPGKGPGRLEAECLHNRACGSFHI